MKKVLKLFSVLCLTALMFTFSSCKKEKTQAELIVGTWNCITLTEEGGETVDLASMGYTWTFTFNSDNTFSTKVDNNEASGTYTIGDNKLSITANGETENLSITTLTESDLTATSTIKSVGIIHLASEIVADTVWETPVTMTFKKQ